MVASLRNPENLGLIALLGGLSTLASNRRGVGAGQALGQGLLGGLSAFAQLRQGDQQQKLQELQIQQAEAEMERGQQQAAAQASQGQARSALFGGFDPTTGVNFNTPRPASAIQAGGGQQALMAQAFPEEFGQAMLSQALAPPPKPVPVGPGGTLVRPDTGQTVFTAPPRQPAPDRTLVEVFDENSPTGTRLVPRAEAIDQFGKPLTGMDIETTPSGGVRVSTGVRRKPGLGTAGANQVDKDLLNSSAALARATAIQQSFDPSFLQLKDRFDFAKMAVQERLGVELAPEDKAELGKFTTFKRRTVESLNKTIKEQTGVAMNAEEAKRIGGQVPVAGQGVFDGDSPTEFESKLNDVTKSLRQAVARAHYVKRRGIDQQDVDLDDMPGIIDQRIAEIRRATLRTNVSATPEQIDAIIIDQITEEFGLPRPRSTAPVDLPPILPPSTPPQNQGFDRAGFR